MSMTMQGSIGIRPGSIAIRPAGSIAIRPAGSIGIRPAGSIGIRPAGPGTVPAPRVQLDQVVVSVSSHDPIVLAGLRACLRDAPGVTLAEPTGLRPDVGSPGRRCDVAIVAGPLCEQTYAEVRAQRATGTRRVLVCTDSFEPAGLFAAVEAGACGVLSRAEATPTRVSSAVRTAAAGDGGLPPELLGRLLAHMQEGLETVHDLKTIHLSARETHVLRLISNGFDTHDIAEELCYNERTVKNVIHDITTRLHLRNRAHAVAFAVRQGLI